MGVGESFVSEVAKKTLQLARSGKFSAFIGKTFEEADKVAKADQISKSIHEHEADEYQEFLDHINAKLKNGSDIRDAFSSAVGIDAMMDGPIYGSCVGTFQAAQKIRGDIFEAAVAILLRHLKLDCEKQNKNGYPDFFICDNKGKLRAFITCKGSIRERYRQAIKERENMVALGNGNLPFYLATLETDIAESSKNELSASHVVFIGASDYEKLARMLISGR